MTDHGALRGDPGAARPGGQGDDPVPGPVAPPARCFELGPGKLAQFLPQEAGGPVEGLDGVAVVGHQQGVLPVGDVVGPGLDHVVHGLVPARGRVDPAAEGVPGHRGGHVPGAQLVEGVALGRVTLAEVVA